MQNILDFSRQFNWVDILVFIVFLRIIFISLKQGLEIELFKLLGVCCGLYLSFHYYFSLADYMDGRSQAKALPGPIIQLSAFVILFVLGYLLFWLLRILVFRFMTAQLSPFLSKWGGFALGILRGLLISSLILFALLIPRSVYFRDSIHYSLSGPYVLRSAGDTYSWVWEKIVSKLNPEDKFNNMIHNVYSAEPKQKKNK
jgi:uncharacterized membrane protein required for colicin V production